MVHSASHDQLVVTGLPINCVINPPSSIDLWPQSLLKNPWRQLKWEKRRNVDRSVPLRWVSGRWWDRMRFICRDMTVWTFPSSKPAFQSQTWVKAKEDLKPKGDEHRCASLDESAINRSPQRLKMQSSCRNKNKQTKTNWKQPRWRASACRGQTAKVRLGWRKRAEIPGISGSVFPSNSNGSVIQTVDIVIHPNPKSPPSSMYVAPNFIIYKGQKRVNLYFGEVVRGHLQGLVPQTEHHWEVLYIPQWLQHSLKQNLVIFKQN